MAKKKTPALIETLSYDAQHLIAVIEEETDLAAVLIAASYLDECLASILHRFFVQGGTADKLLDPVNGKVGSFGARADLAYVLGFVSKPALVDLQLIGELRNLFAHSRLTIDMSSPAAEEILKRLKYFSIIREEMRLTRPASEQGHFWLDRPLSLRETFRFTVALLSHHLLLTGLNVAARQRFVGWVQTYMAKRQDAG